MKRWLIRLAAALALMSGLGLSVVMCARVAARGRYATPYSMVSAGPSGTKAAFVLAGELGHDPRAWREDFGRLPPRANIVAMGGCLHRQRRQLSRYEQESLTEWLRAGGVLFVAGATGYLPPELPVRLERVPRQCGGIDLTAELAAAGAAGPQKEETVAPAGPATEPGDAPDSAEPPTNAPGNDGDPLSGLPPHPAFLSQPQVELFDEPPPVLTYYAEPMHELLGDIGGLAMRQPAKVKVHGTVEHQVLATLGQETVIADVPIGEGRVVVLGSAHLLTNRALGQDHGGVVWSRLLQRYANPGQPLLFDEYHLGAGSVRSTMRYLREAGGTAILLQLFFVVALLVTRFGRRFGPVEGDPPKPPGGTASYVDATSALYARVTDRHALVTVLRQQALQRIAAHHHVPFSDEATMAKRLTERRQLPAAAAVRALAELAARVVRTERELVAITRDIDAQVAAALVPLATPQSAPSAQAAPSAAPTPETPAPAAAPTTTT